MSKAQAIYAYNVAQNEINIDRVLAKAFGKVTDGQLINAITEAKTHDSPSAIVVRQPHWLDGPLAPPVKIPFIGEERIKASDAFKTIERRAHDIDPACNVDCENSIGYGIMTDYRALFLRFRFA